MSHERMDKTSNTRHQAAPRVLQRKCACGQHSPKGECEACAKKKYAVQRKLVVGASNDPLEQEADRVADQVLAMPLHPPIDAVAPRIHRFSEQQTGAVAPDSVEQVISGAGQPMAPILRHEMEQRFGYDFSSVRLHSGAAAERSARDVNAYAYTVGNNIVFGAGQFTPLSRSGSRLLAHELTHVVQQTPNVAAKTVRRDGPVNTETDLNTRLAELIPDTASSSSQGPVEPQVTARARAFLSATRTVLNDVHRDVNTLLNLMSGMSDFVSQDEVNKSIGLMILYESLDALAVAVPEAAEAVVTVVAKTIKVVVMANELQKQANATNQRALGRATETTGLFELLIEAQTSVDELSNRVQFEPNLAEFLAQQPVPAVPRRVATQISREIELHLMISFLRRSGDPVETQETETVVLPRSGNPMDTDMNINARAKHEHPLENFWLRRLRIRAEWSTLRFSATGNTEYSWYYWKIKGSKTMVSFFLNRLDHNHISKERLFEGVLGNSINYR